MPFDTKTWALTLARANVKPPQVEAWAPHFGAALYAEAFTNGMTEMIEFLTQVLHETGYLIKTSENLNYSVSGLLTTFGKARISEAQAQKVGRIDGVQAADQRAIANIVYGGTWGRAKLGNTMPEDGWTFRGAGLLQTTGRDNFMYLKDKTGIDVLTNPNKLRDPGIDAVKLAIAQWKRLVKPEMLGNEVSCRKAINGGGLGLDECRNIRSRLVNIFA